MSSPLATSGLSEERIKPIATKPDFSFPKQHRLLRSGDYRRAYREGLRLSGPFFRAFCFARAEGSGPRVGFTVPKAVGKAVDRNRIKRRMREAVRYEIGALEKRWDVVFNPSRRVLEASLPDLRREVRKVLRRCSAS